MQALIDPRSTPIYHAVGWNPPVPPFTEYSPVMEAYPNSARVCQVEPDENVFPVADPLYWIACPDNAVADLWYCDMNNNVVAEIINAPKP